jgi:Arc/MetJ-type ribon-helix-helix transcriptional regulator
MSNLIQAEVPERLWQQAQTLVAQGWASSVQELVNESLRRYLESHQDTLAEQFIQEDVVWGLHGKD